MNTGTKIRTVMLLIAVINQAISQVGEPDFGDERVNTAYKVVSYIFMVLAAAVAGWYNNDFTEEAAAGTGLTRQLKAEKKAGYIGDTFYDDVDEPTDFEEDEGGENEQENLETNGQ